MVSWDDTQLFIAKLNELTKMSFRLPTAAEWEYRARGGGEKAGNRCTFAGSSKLSEVGWYSRNSHQESKNVGLKRPNDLGLYDMSGNVREWCYDFYNARLPGGFKTDWLQTQKNSKRIFRGGGWEDFAIVSRAGSCGDGSSELTRSKSLGFRLALGPILEK